MNRGALKILSFYIDIPLSYKSKLLEYTNDITRLTNMYHYDDASKSFFHYMYVSQRGRFYITAMSLENKRHINNIWSDTHIEIVNPIHTELRNRLGYS